MKSLVPKAIAPPFARYAHGVELPVGARIVRTSGQLGLASDGAVPDGAEAQAMICFSNISHILAEAGMDATHVCHVSAFVTDRAHMAGYMAARDAFLSQATVLPTSTLMIVSGFTRPEFLVEVEVWAAGPDGAQAV
ncbi:MAG: RidA family protein [Roseobacter sp.]|jgi:enamine deaminase RidA (YjgF/YER057c/UK114 family)|nr:RidA family protein [Roseobacter sp.]